MVIVESFVYCYLNCEVICGLIGVGVRVVGFGFVVACRGVSLPGSVVEMLATDQLPGCPLAVLRRNISGLCRRCRSRAPARTMPTGNSQSLSMSGASCVFEDEGHNGVEAESGAMKRW